MDENLRVALIQFLNSRGEAPDPASPIELYGTDEGGFGDLVIRYKRPRSSGTYFEATALDMAQFLLEYQVT